MSFHYKPISEQILYKNRYFICKNNEDNYFLSNKPSIDSSFVSDFHASLNGFSEIPCLDLDGNTFTINDNFISSTQLIEHNFEQHLLFFHVTMDEFLESIKEEGLKPQIGLLSSELGEEKEQIYLFPNEEQMNNALSNWMGEFYEEHCEEIDIDPDDLILHSLFVKIPVHQIEHFLDESSVGYEAISSKPIPENLIHYHSVQ